MSRQMYYDAQFRAASTRGHIGPAIEGVSFYSYDPMSALLAHADSKSLALSSGAVQFVQELLL